MNPKVLVKRSPGGEEEEHGNSESLGHTLMLKLDASSSDIVFHFLLSLGFLLLCLGLLKLISFVMDGQIRRKRPTALCTM
jgi:hypothetical protein